MTKTIKFTKQGFNNIQSELHELQQKRPGVVAELSAARDMGDRSENAAYKVARQKLSSLDRRIRELNRIIRYAIVVEPTSSDTIEIGSQVTVKHEGQNSVFTIVGGYESDIENGLISCFSPIGKALLGKKTGIQVSIQVPAGIKEYEVIQVKNG